MTISLQAQGVQKRYGGVVALADGNLEVQGGEVVRGQLEGLPVARQCVLVLAEGLQAVPPVGPGHHVFGSQFERPVVTLNGLGMPARVVEQPALVDPGVGELRFELGGQEHCLTGYRFAAGSSDSVFVPFLDGTSGKESYGTDRYLDLDPDPGDDTYVLDFNLAYHPSCVYDPRFSCPLTPAENRLPVRIEAGERLPAGA